MTDLDGAHGEDVVGQQDQSLVRSALVRMALRVAVVIVAMTLATYWYVFHTVEQQQLDSLEQYVTQRVKREAFIFQAVES
jgi:dipeptide/tripeptide permease